MVNAKLGTVQEMWMMLSSKSDYDKKSIRGSKDVETCTGGREEGKKVRREQRQQNNRFGMTDGIHRGITPLVFPSSFSVSNLCVILVISREYSFSGHFLFSISQWHKSFK